MKIAYTRTATSEGRVRFAPLLEVRLHGPAGVQRLQMLVDSGSEESLVPRPIAELLGVPVVVGRVASVEIRFKDQGFLSRVVVSDVALPVLGHQDFFNRFRVTFDSNERAFYVVPHRPQ